MICVYLWCERSHAKPQAFLQVKVPLFIIIFVFFHVVFKHESGKDEDQEIFTIFMLLASYLITVRAKSIKNP